MLNLPFKKLQIWQRGRLLAKEVQKMTEQFPKEERYGLTSQMRNCSRSIASNIAEGSQRSTNKDFANFILIAKGSLAELETQIIMALDYGYISKQEHDRTIMDIDELGKMIYTFHKRLTTSH